MREMVQLGFIDVAGDKYPVLKLNQKSFDILSGKTFVNLTKPKETAKEIVTQTKILPAQPERKIDTKLFEILRTLRKELADAEKVPPYIIFPDTALHEMSTFFPQSMTNMAQIKGVGSVKLERYGQKFLEKIIEHCRQNDVNEKTIYSENKITDTERQTLGLVKQGLNLEDIAKVRGFVTTTIASHIERLIQSGEEIDIDKFVSKEKQEAIIKCMQSTRAYYVKEIKEQLGEEYSYDEIRIARAKPRKAKL